MKIGLGIGAQFSTRSWQWEADSISGPNDANVCNVAYGSSKNKIPSILPALDIKNA